MKLAFRKFFMKENKILLLGGTGFLGNALYLSLSKHAHNNVFIFSRNSETQKNHICGNILNEHDLFKLNEMEFDLVINLTGQITNPIEHCLKTNSIGIQNIIKLKQQNPALKIMHLSSVTVYGSGNAKDESSTLNPESPYASAKAMAEMLLTSAIPAKDLLIIRLANLYGSKQLKGVFAYLKRSAQTDKKLEFNNDGSLTRYFMHVDDCANYLTTLIECFNLQLNGLFNLTGKERYSIKELVSLYENIKQIKFNTHYANIAPPDNPTEIDSNKMNNMLPFKNTYSITQYLLQ